MHEDLLVYIRLYIEKHVQECLTSLGINLLYHTLWNIYICMSVNEVNTCLFEWDFKPRTVLVLLKLRAFFICQFSFINGTCD